MMINCTEFRASFRIRNETHKQKLSRFSRSSQLVIISPSIWAFFLTESSLHFSGDNVCGMARKCIKLRGIGDDDEHTHLNCNRRNDFFIFEDLLQIKWLHIRVLWSLMGFNVFILMPLKLSEINLEERSLKCSFYGQKLEIYFIDLFSD